MTHLNCGFYARTLEKNSRVLLALPEGGPAVGTLWLLHPPGGSCFDWERNTCAARYAQRAGLILVMPMSDRAELCGRDEPMLRYLGEELPAFLEKLVLPLREGGGAMVAGPGARQLQAAYPQRFAQVLELELDQGWAGAEESLRRALEALS